MGRPRNFARADEIAAGVVEGYTLERVGASIGYSKMLVSRRLDSMRAWLAGYLRDESWIDRDERTNVQVAREWLAAEGRPSSGE